MKNIATPENTVFLTVVAFEDYEAKTVALRKSAEEHGVTLVFCDAEQEWQGFYRHKIANMQTHLRGLYEKGKRFAFILDSRDVIFIENIDVILHKFNALDSGRAIFNHDVAGKIWPSHNETLRLEIEKRMNSVHARLNAGMIAGKIETLLKIQELATELRSELLQERPRDGFVGEVFQEIGTAHLDDDQHLYQMTLACYPELFQIDYAKQLFAVLMSYPQDMNEYSDDPTRHDVVNGAAIVHSPWLSRNQKWVKRAIESYWGRKKTHCFGDENHRQPRIKVLQYMHGNCEYFPYSERINRRYCERHGYDYVLRRDPPRADRHICWHKVPLILNELHDCNYLLFLDADAFFYSQELSIHDEMTPLMGAKEILMAQDFGCESLRWTPGKPNSGVILMENSDVVREFFEYWNSASDIDESTRWSWPPEQRALWDVVMPKFGDRLEVHPEYYLIQGRYGQFIRHYMLMPNEERLEKMKTFCQFRNIQ